MRTLVTGGGGFLGSAIVELLISRGDHVRVLARNRYPRLEKLGAECVQGDIRNSTVASAACMGMEAVYHVAALPGIWGRRRDYYAVNVTGTRNIIEGCKRRGVPKLVYTSSPSVVFNMQDENGIDESAPYPAKFFNPYSQTKALAERAVLQSAGKDGLMSCALRPHLIWGPGDPNLLPRLIARARKRRLWIVGGGQNRVDLTFIRNAAHAHLLAADAMTPRRVSGEAYFISDGNPVLLWDWINELLRRLQIPTVKGHLPVWMAYTAGRCFESLFWLIRRRKEPPMTRFLAKALSCSHFYNIAKARRDFAYQPIVSNEQGLQEAAAYFLKNPP